MIVNKLKVKTIITRIETIVTLHLSLATKALNPSTNIAENVAHLSLGPGRNLIIVKRKLAIMGIMNYYHKEY